MVRESQRERERGSGIESKNEAKKKQKKKKKQMRSSQFWQITAANYSSLKTRRRGRARRRMKATGNERERKVLAEANGFTLNSVK